MGIAIKATHDCHQVNWTCNAVCCPIGMAEPIDTCPITHTVREN